MKLDDLKNPFPKEFISWRVGATNKDKTKAIALAYIDARDVMDRLDAVCGADNWQNKHPHANGKTSCAIGIKIGSEWVWKENGAGDSQVEAEKGAFSDALKRAAVLWGVGRYLYDVPNVWVDIEPYGKSYKIKNPKDPVLARALNQAEKGIRLSAEPFDTQPENMSGEEFLMLQKAIKESDTLDSLKNAMYKVNAAARRMTDEQKGTLTREKDVRKSFLSQMPVNGDAHA